MAKFCSECGKDVNELNIYCPNCGFNLKKNNVVIKKEKNLATTAVKNFLNEVKNEIKEENIATKRKKSPATAAILNFLFTGVGYIYLGKLTLGILFLFIGSILGLIILSSGPGTILLFLPIDFILAWHAYRLAKDINAKQIALD